MIKRLWPYLQPLWFRMSVAVVCMAMVAGISTGVMREGLTVVGLIGFIFYPCWKFALICFSILPIAAAVLTHLGIKSRRAGREGQAKMSELYHIIQEAVLAMPIVKTFPNESKE